MKKKEKRRAPAWLAAGAAVLCVAAAAFWIAGKSKGKLPVPAGDRPAARPPANDPLSKRAVAELEALAAAMTAYREDVGELPPRGDDCAYCAGYVDGKLVTDWKKLTPATPRVHMTRVEEVLMKKDGDGWDGPYLSRPIPKDPWGREYTYDDNDPRGANAGDTRVWSAGPDGVYETADDVSVTVLTLREGNLSLEDWRRARRNR